MNWTCSAEKQLMCDYLPPLVDETWVAFSLLSGQVFINGHLLGRALPPQMDVWMGFGHRSLIIRLLLLASSGYRLECPPDFTAIFVHNYTSWDQKQQEDHGPCGRTWSRTGAQTRPGVIPRDARVVDHDLPIRKQDEHIFNVIPCQACLKESFMFSAWTSILVSVLRSETVFKIGISGLQAKSMFRKRAKSTQRSINR